MFKGKSKLERSHIGQIIMSTTLNTQSKVIEQYGGTTWTKIEGRFLLGASSSYPVNAIGGETKHTLSVEEMPNHTHELYGALTGETKLITNTGNDFAQTTTDFSVDTYIKNTGGGQPHNNMPPYKAVYIWERTA